MDTKFQDNSAQDIHLGRNVQRIREIVGYKQITLAEIVNLSQQSISKWEQSKEIPDDILEKLADGLGVSVDFIKNFKEERAIYNIQTNRDESKQNSLNYQPTITYDAADKITELLEKLILEDRVKTESMSNLSKAVSDLAEEVKKLKGRN